MSITITKSQLTKLIKEEIGSQMLKENKAEKAWRTFVTNVRKLNPTVALVSVDDYHEFDILQDNLKQFGLKYNFYEINTSGKLTKHFALFWIGSKPNELLKQLKQLEQVISQSDDDYYDL